MKNSKIRLKNLKVKSFVIGMNDKLSNTAKGGIRTYPFCPPVSFKIDCISQGAEVCSDGSC